MTEVLLFNPENDIALASNLEHFTPSANVMRFHRDCAMLPVWYASSPLSVILVNEINYRWVEYIEKLLCRHLNIVTSVSGSGDYCALPWGWSRNARFQLRRLGISSESLPDDAQLDAMRELSHRRTAIKLWEYLSDKVGYELPECSIEIRTIAEFELFAKRHDSAVMLKSPWSSSGRGVIDCTKCSADQIRRQVEGVIAHQGSIIAEKKLDKILDFAMLFKLDCGNASHIGYSVFSTNDRGAYTGNYVESDDLLLKRICRYIDEATVKQTANLIADGLSRIIGSCYCGYAGVDMLLYRLLPSGEIRIAPTIEVNLRTTMGVVAWHLKNIMNPEKTGLFSICYSHGETMPDSAIFENGRLMQGRFSLTPSDGCRFKAVLQTMV